MEANANTNSVRMEEKRAVLEEIRALLESEKVILENFYKLEQEKRKAILGIQARKLQELTKSEDSLQKKLHSLGERREALFGQVLGGGPKNLSRLLGLFPEGSQQHRQWSKLADAYRSTGQRLAELVRQNEALLHETGASIQRVLESLQIAVQTELSPGYAPKGRQGRQVAASVFLNSHA